MTHKGRKTEKATLHAILGGEPRKDFQTLNNFMFVFRFNGGVHSQKKVFRCSRKLKAIRLGYLKL